MDVAVGRLQFSVKLAETPSRATQHPVRPEVDPAEAAFQREQSRRELTAEREHWAMHAPRHTGVIQ